MAIASPSDIIDRLTVEEFFAVAVRHDWTRVELEDGRVVEMAPEHSPHVYTAAKVKADLEAVFTWRRTFQTGTLPLTEFTAYEPDVWVLDKDLVPAPGTTATPAEVLLVVEVSASSRARDLGRKAVTYAAAGIPECWVVEPEAGVLHRHTEPTTDGYASVVRFDVGAHAEHLDVSAVLTIPRPLGA